MPKPPSYPFLTKLDNSDNWYLQFHIKPWMREIPRFRWSIYANRKNVKKPLKTSSMAEAVSRMHQDLEVLGLELNDKLETLEPKRYTAQPTTADEHYWATFQTTEKLNKEELIEFADIKSDLFGEEISGFSDLNNPEGKKSVAIYEAQTAAIARRLLKEDEKNSPAPHTYRITLLDAVKLQLSEYEKDQVALKTRGKLKTAVKKFLIFIEEADIQVDLVREKQVNRYVTNARRTGIPKSTIASEINELRKLWTYLQIEEIVHTNPWRGLRLERFSEPKIKLPFKPCDAEALTNFLYKKTQKELILVLALTYYTGMRMEEVFEVTFSNTPQGETSSFGKLWFNVKADGSGKSAAATRDIPVHSALYSWLKKNDLFFSEGLPCPWPTSLGGLNKRFNRQIKAWLSYENRHEQQDKLSHHSLRHGFQTQLLDQKVSEVFAAPLMGHKLEKITVSQASTYWHQQPPSKIELVEMIEAIDIPNIGSDWLKKN